MKNESSWIVFFVLGASLMFAQGADPVKIGAEVAVPRHLQDGEEYQLPLRALIDFGQKLFTANWTIQEGAGRPMTKGTGAPLSDPGAPLLFPRNFVSVR